MEEQHQEKSKFTRSIMVQLLELSQIWLKIQNDQPELFEKIQSDIAADGIKPMERVEFDKYYTAYDSLLSRTISKIGTMTDEAYKELLVEKT
jgi:hypothetical protein